MNRFLYILFIYLLQIQHVIAQNISGAVVDAETGDSIPSATVAYKAHKVYGKANDKGIYTIARHDGWKITVSAVGYKSQTLLIDSDVKGTHIDVILTPKTTSLQEVTIKKKRSRYSRKENPAVELMKRVIAAKHVSNLKNKPFYSFTKYNKTKIAINNIKPSVLDKKAVQSRSWLNGQIETCDLNNKLIMPIMVQERVTKNIFRKDPEAERTLLIGEKSSGLNELFETGDIANVMAGDVFTPIDIYDNNIRLLHQRFTSPISDDAIGFYRFYIVDTLQIDRDSCIHLSFLPNNQQDFGFRGDLYVVNDTSLHVRRIRLGLPKSSIVNYVNNMEVEQEYQRIGLPGREDWVLSANDMLLELSAIGESGEFAVINTSRFYEYSFAPIADKEFKGKSREQVADNAEYQDEQFWTRHRGDTPLSQGEEHTSSFIDGLTKSKGFGWVAWVLKAFIENFVETSPTGKPSYFDVGPVNTIVSNNIIDGMRYRLGGQTTANLNRHLFFKGYAAYGSSSRKKYYSAALTYSFNKKKYLPTNYPQRFISFESSYDICNPSDRFVTTDKDNVFTSFRWTDSYKMAFYNRQKLTFINEQENGLKVEAYAKSEENEAVGDFFFRPLSSHEEYQSGGRYRVTEFNITLQYSPGAKYFNTKQNSRVVNREAPVFTLSHTMGVKGLLGGQYNYNVTELKAYKLFFLKSWGSLNCYLKGGVQWSQVPFPLLIAPAANLSYMSAPSADTFNLINGAEFMNDRYLSAILSWKLNGKLFNRIPLLKKLKWREYVAVKALWGGLSDKNNPYLSQNANSDILMVFPEGYNVMDTHIPYVEGVVGIHQILKLFNIDYVHRFNYLHLPTASRHGIRFSFEFTF